MMPSDISELSVFDAFKMQVKVFVLKNYPELAKSNPEYVAALSRFSGITQDDVKTVLSGALTPAAAADAIAEKWRLCTATRQFSGNVAFKASVSSSDKWIDCA